MSRLLGGKIRRASRLFEGLCIYAERLEGGVSEDIFVADNGAWSIGLPSTWAVFRN